MNSSSRKRSGGAQREREKNKNFYQTLVKSVKKLILFFLSEENDLETAETLIPSTSSASGPEEQNVGTQIINILNK